MEKQELSRNALHKYSFRIENANLATLKPPKSLMMKRVYAGLFAIATTLSCCSDERTPDIKDEPETDFDIHIVGWKTEASGETHARYLRNDESIVLPVNNLGTDRSKVNDIQVDEAGNVYIAGSRDIAVGKSGPYLWVNGGESSIFNFTPGNYGELTAIYLGQNGIYAVGMAANFNGNFAADWSTSAAGIMSKVAGSSAFAVAASPSAKVILVMEGNSTRLIKNGNVESIDQASTLTSVAFQNSDELIIGTRCAGQACTATLWRNRAPETLPEGIEANAITVYKDDLFIAGKTCCEAAYWRNGVLVKLTEGGTATSIGIQNDHVIVGGRIGSKQVYWLDGVMHELVGFTTVTGVALTMK